MSIFLLSDEILLKIISHLNSNESLINLSQTCQKLNELLQDRTLCRALDFPWNTKIERSRLVKFLSEFDRANFITKLQLHDLYWIPSGSIRSIVLKLKNLKSLYAAGTKLSWNHLSQILKLRELEDLSWSWDHLLEESVRVGEEKKDDAQMYHELLSLKDAFNRLKFLMVHIPLMPTTTIMFTSHSALSYIISLCNRIEELYILSWPQTLQERRSSSHFHKEVFHPGADFPNLKTFVINVKEIQRIYCPKLLKIVYDSLIKNGNGSTLTKFWIDHPLLTLNSGRVLVTAEREIPNSSHYFPNNNEKSKSLVKMDSLKYFTFPITDSSIKFAENNKFEKLEHLRITQGLPRVVSLNGMFSYSTQLKSFLSKAFNYKLFIASKSAFIKDWMKFFQLHPLLEELNVSEDNSIQYPEICLGITYLKNLRKLSLPLFSLLEIKTNPIVSDYELAVLNENNGLQSVSNIIESTQTERPNNEHSFKPRRVSPIATQKEVGVSGLDLATYYSPHVTEFELGFTQIESRVGRMMISSLRNIKRWKNLVKLTFDKVPISDGKFLIEILSSCSKIESLRLTQLGPRGKCIYLNDLCVALKNCAKLKSFRLDQNYIGSCVPLFESLSTCKELERLLIFSSPNDQPLEKKSLENLIGVAERLFVVYLVIGSTKKGDCKDMRIYLESKFRPSRTPFTIFIQNELNAEETRFDCPSVHYRQLVVFSPQVCEKWCESLPTSTRHNNNKVLLI